jgi:hypothetical protein
MNLPTTDHATRLKVDQKNALYAIYTTNPVVFRALGNCAAPFWGRQIPQLERLDMERYLLEPHELQVASEGFSTTNGLGQSARLDSLPVDAVSHFVQGAAVILPKKPLQLR